MVLPFRVGQHVSLRLLTRIFAILREKLNSGVRNPWISVREIRLPTCG